MVDVEITLTIPEDKVEEFRVHFLLAAPKGSFRGSDLEWVEHLLRLRCIKLYRIGKKIAEETDIDYQDVIPEKEGI